MGRSNENYCFSFDFLRKFGHLKRRRTFIGLISSIHPLTRKSVYPIWPFEASLRHALSFLLPFRVQKNAGGQGTAGSGTLFHSIRNIIHPAVSTASASHIPKETPHIHS